MPRVRKNDRVETDDDRKRRREHAKKTRDANRKLRRCLDETKYKKHRKPARGKVRCSACLKKHRT